MKPTAGKHKVIYKDLKTGKEFVSWMEVREATGEEKQKLPSSDDLFRTGRGR